MTAGHVVVVGAGVAGLAASRRLRAAGVTVSLIEAGHRAGGRAWTAAFRGEVFDHGAAWLHGADRNPLAAMAVAEDRLIDSDRAGAERVSLDGRLATAAECLAYRAAWDRLEDVTAPALTGPDTSLADALAPMSDDPWTHLVALWEGPTIAAADADRLGLLDWHRNRLGGRNLVPPDGLGAYLLRKLATGVVCGTPATRIHWGGLGVQVDTPKGGITADAVIVTVSTGVLAAGSIRFDPALPHSIQDAITALPMGLLSKVALPPTGAARLGLAPETRVVDQAGRMTFIAWPQRRAHLVGFLGGSQAWDASRTRGAASELARSELRRALGDAALREVGADTLETSWGTDPLFRGAYAYAGPGDADARGVLADAFPAERLQFAGEAARTDGTAGTVAGAYLSGVAAAERLIAAPEAAPAGSP